MKKLGISKHQILSDKLKSILKLTMTIVIMEQTLKIVSGYIILWKRALKIAIGTNKKLNMSVYEVITTGSKSRAFDISMTIVERAQM